MLGRQAADPGVSVQKSTTEHRNGNKQQTLHYHDGTIRRGLTLLTAGQILNMPPVEYLVDGLIPKDGLTVIYGAPGCGKTFISLHYALQVAKGHHVVYMAGEGQAGYGQRLQAYGVVHGFIPDKFRLIPQSVPLIDDEAVNALISTIAALSPALVIVDTLACAMQGGDENSAKDMGQLTEACRRVKRETGAAVLLIHHSGKHGGSERGSSALRGAADVMAELTRDKGDGPIKLACTKSKDAEPFVSRHFRLKVVETPSGGTSCAVVAAEPGKGGKPNLTENERTVLELMTQRSSSNEGVTRKDIIELGGIPEGSVQHVLPSLVRRGFVQQEKKRAPYYITNEGLAAVNSEKAETEYHSEP